MVVDEYKSDATIIRFDDKYIGTKEEDKEILDILLSLTIKKISEYSWMICNFIWPMLNSQRLDKINKGRRYFGRINI